MEISQPPIGTNFSPILHVSSDFQNSITSRLSEMLLGYSMPATVTQLLLIRPFLGGEGMIADFQGVE